MRIGDCKYDIEFLWLTVFRCKCQVRIYLGTTQTITEVPVVCDLVAVRILSPARIKIHSERRWAVLRNRCKTYIRGSIAIISNADHVLPEIRTEHTFIQRVVPDIADVWLPRVERVHICQHMILVKSHYADPPGIIGDEELALVLFGICVAIVKEAGYARTALKWNCVDAGARIADLDR